MGPSIRIVGTSIDANGGVVPSDGVIQIAFDRYLLPSTITRQSYGILDATNKQLDGPRSLQTIYDPVARTVTITGPDGPGKPWLTVDASYKLLLTVAPDPATDLGGFRAIDRAVVWHDQKREFVFRAGPPAQQVQYEPAVDFCADVMPIFDVHCSGSDCHGSASARSSLILDTSSGVRLTAIGRVAQGSNTGPRAYLPEPTQRLFGMNLALIEPRDPGSSWLMYKLELAPLPKIDAGADAIPKYFCTPPAGAPPVPAPAPPYATLSPAVIEANDVERSILNDYVLGREMPYASPFPLTFQQRETIRIWIARGAETRECGGCGQATKKP